MNVEYPLRISECLNCFAGFLSAVKSLIEKGADIETEGRFGTALHNSSMYGNWKS